MAFDPLLAVVGLPLLFFLPGLAVGAATFPEKLRSGAGWQGPVELAVMAVVGSVAITVLLGSLLAASPAGLGSTSADPSLWIADGAVVVAGGVLWAVRRDAPTPAHVETPPPDEGWSRLRALERLAREERRVQHELRHGVGEAGRREALELRLSQVRAERRRLTAQAEAEFAS